MNKSQHLLNTKKSEQLQTEKEIENVSKSHASAHGRFLRLSTFLAQKPASLFQIRKPLNVYMIEELEKLGRKTYFQRVYIFGLNISEEQKKGYLHNSDLHQLDFRDYFQRYVDTIFETCEKHKCTQDNFSGLFIVMGTSHSFLIIEGAEDMIANFFEEYDLVHDKIWITSRVFLVEDKIGETYFNCFYSRCSPAINTNEKFPPSTSDDCNLMTVQHLKIKENVKSLIETLAHELKNSSNLDESSKDIPTHQFDLPADPYNKLLPEIQRMDLVLNANKLYRTVKDFSQTYRVLQTHQDEDALLWPIQNNYTPLDIFKRSEFDVNLTFGHYDKEESNENQQSVSQEKI